MEREIWGIPPWQRIEILGSLLLLVTHHGFAGAPALLNGRFLVPSKQYLVWVLIDEWAWTKQKRRLGLLDRPRSLKLTTEYDQLLFTYIYIYIIFPNFWLKDLCYKSFVNWFLFELICF